LIDRKKLASDWYGQWQDIQQRIQELISNLPNSQELEKIINEQNNKTEAVRIEYFIVVKVVEYLKRTEGDLSLFRQYTSTRLKDWIKIQESYEKNGIYLGEIANYYQKFALFEL